LASAYSLTEIAGRIAAHRGSSVWLVHVGDWDDPQHAQAFSEQASVLATESGSEPKVVEAKGHATREVPDLTRQERVSLVVLGSRGLTGVKALGSVSERIAHSSDASVLIARPKS
jgi:nucleotide-binding universal stress UspA family protein